MLKRFTFDIHGTGTYLPSNILTSDDLDKMAGLDGGTTQASYGVQKRFWANSEETSSMMATKAAEKALREAGWDANSLDVIVGACGVMEQPIPGTSVLVQQKLGLGDSGIACFDVNATCLSFLQAFDVVITGFASGKWKRALIVSADIASAALDFTNPEAAVIFGDGAAAVALSADGDSELIAYQFNTFGEASSACALEAGGTKLRPDDDLDDFLARCKFKMDGTAVFKATAKRLPGFLSSLLLKAGLKDEDITAIIPHQASAPALEHLKRSVHQGHEKTVDIFGSIGNQIATSLPFALHHYLKNNSVNSGDHLMLIGSSAGISLGGAIIRW